MRNLRHAKILELITDNEIETQEELCDELNKYNFNVTQATISRDIKQLHLYKVFGKTKKYRYTFVAEKENTLPSKMKTLFKESVVSIESANNLVVVKTLSGNASYAGAVIDKSDFEEVLGSIAGDDTLLIVAKTEVLAQRVVDKIKDLVK